MFEMLVCAMCIGALLVYIKASGHVVRDLCLERKYVLMDELQVRTLSYGVYT